MPIAHIFHELFVNSVWQKQCQQVEKWMVSTLNTFNMKKSRLKAMPFSLKNRIFALVFENDSLFK